MKTIESIGEDFTKSLSSAASITELNQTILDIASNTIRALGRVSNNLGGDANKNAIRALNRIADNAEVKQTLQVVYGQQIVLYISAFETYLKDITRHLGNTNINMFTWSEGEKLYVDTKDLNKRIVTTGDLVLSAILKKDISFQDLKSIKKFFKQYLNIELELDEDIQEAYIIATAMRHVIVHSGGVVDPDFMYQIRNLPSATQDGFSVDGFLPITQTDVDTTQATLMNMYSAIEAELVFRINKNHDV